MLQYLEKFSNEFSEMGFSPTITIFTFISNLILYPLFGSARSSFGSSVLNKRQNNPQIWNWFPTKEISAAESKKIRLILPEQLLLVFNLKIYPLIIFPIIGRQFDAYCWIWQVFPVLSAVCQEHFRNFFKLNFLKSIYYNPASVIFWHFPNVLFGYFCTEFYNYKFSVSFNRKTLFAFIAL